jgi:hypothetical protein
MSAEMECTPSTRKSHGGTSRPSISANGSTKPPMHASTWQLAPTAGRQFGDLRDRVDHTLRVLRGRPDHEHGAVIDSSAMASTSAVQSSRTGALRTVMSNM